MGPKHEPPVELGPEERQAQGPTEEGAPVVAEGPLAPAPQCPREQA